MEKSTTRARYSDYSDYLAMYGRVFRVFLEGAFKDVREVIDRARQQPAYPSCVLVPKQAQKGGGRTTNQKGDQPNTKC